MERTIICISRQYGSGGREIGEAVAKKLGIPCYDKCLIQKAAQEAGLSETAVAEYDEKGEDFGIAVSGNPFADTAALGEAFYSEEARVFEAERRAILELAEKGDCVIIGRCASAILRAAGYRPLSVFIYADSADRAKRIAAHCKSSLHHLSPLLSVHFSHAVLADLAISLMIRICAVVRFSNTSANSFNDALRQGRAYFPDGTEWGDKDATKSTILSNAALIEVSGQSSCMAYGKAAGFPRLRLFFLWFR